jgi:hypothetical protein
MASSAAGVIHTFPSGKCDRDIERASGHKGFEILWRRLIFISCVIGFQEFANVDFATISDIQQIELSASNDRQTRFSRFRDLPQGWL